MNGFVAVIFVHQFTPYKEDSFALAMKRV